MHHSTKLNLHPKQAYIQPTPCQPSTMSLSVVPPTMNGSTLTPWEGSGARACPKTHLQTPGSGEFKIRWTSYRVSYISSILHNSSMIVHEAAGPFDDRDGDEAWRNRGTGVYTGDGFVRAATPPSAREKARRQYFWDGYDPRSAEVAAAGPQGQRPILGQLPPAASEELRFPGPLPERSNTPPALLTQQQIPRPVTDHPSLPPPRAPTPPPAAASASAPSSSPPAPTAASRHSSDIDGEYELDDEYLPDVAQVPQAPTSANTSERAQIPRTSSPRAVNEWDDENLLTLWKYKVVRKKGYEPMLTSFENQTVESLHEAWTTHKERCKVLGAAWEAAGNPNGPLSGWFEE